MNVLRHLAQPAPHSHPVGARLESIRSWLSDDLAALEAALTAPTAYNLAERASRHLLSQPGKRLRPLCVFLASRLGAEPPNTHVVRSLATAPAICG